MWNGAAEILKARPADEEDEAEDRRRCRHAALQRRGDAGERDGAGEAVDQRGAVEQHARRQRAEDEVLQAGLGGLGVVAVEGGEDVERQRLQLEAEIERDQVAGRDHHHHADASRAGSGSGTRSASMPLARACSRPTAGSRPPTPISVSDLHEAGEAVGDEGAVEGRRRLPAAGDDQRRSATREQRHARSPLTQPRRALAAEGADQQERRGRRPRGSFPAERGRERERRGRCHRDPQCAASAAVFAAASAA